VSFLLWLVTPQAHLSLQSQSQERGGLSPVTMDESFAVHDSQVRQGPSFRPVTAAAHAAADAAAAELMAQEEQTQAQQKRAAAKATAKKAKKQQQKAKAQQQKSLQSPERLQTAAAAHDTGVEPGDTGSDSDRDLSPDSAERRTKSMKARLSAQGLLPPRQQSGTASRPKPAVVDAIRASWADQNGRVQ